MGTIQIRAGTYTENLTLATDIDLTAFAGDQENPDVTIVGKMTYTGSGIVTVSNIFLETNSDYILANSGSGIVNLINCYIKCLNHTGISASGSATTNFDFSQGDTSTTGIALITSASNGSQTFNYCQFSNTGLTTTQSNCSAGNFQFEYCHFSQPFSSSSAGSLGLRSCTFDCGEFINNTTPITANGTGQVNEFISTTFRGGSASALSIGTNVQVKLLNCEVSSTNTNAITGNGTLYYDPIAWTYTTQSSASYGINVAHQHPIQLFPVLNAGGFAPNYNLVATTYSMVYTDSIVGCNPSSGGFTVTLPSSNLVSGQLFMIRDENLSAGSKNITIAANGGQSIYYNTSTSSYVINQNGGFVVLYYNNAVFFVVASSATYPMSSFTLSSGPIVTGGSGSPNGSVTAPKGSLYLRTDGTTVNDRAFINTDSGTTWTALTTVG